MPTNGRPTFGDLLRRYRGAAGLSQESLAEAARLSTRAISDLERGARQVPRRDTVELLVGALGLTGADRLALETAVVRRRGPRFAQGASPGTPSDPRPRYSLPVPPTPFVGETGQLGRCAALLRDAAASPGAPRLVTLTGPGGVGKTRLALEVAAEVQEAFGDGVAFASLAAVRDPDLVAATCAQVVGLAETGGGDALAALKAFLYPRHILLILDNFEQVMAAAPLVAEVLAACPRLRVVVTSRSPLHVRGEQEIAVLPLALPDPGQQLSVQAIQHVPAVSLFVQRVRSHDPDFALTESTALAVAEICRRLDGLPLAIELAAARGRFLPPQAMVARLTSRLTLLVGGVRDLPARQQTLRSVLEWSYDLLTPEEAAVFRRLAVFAGGCTLEAAEEIVGEATRPARQHDLIDIVESLADKSLLEREEQPPVADEAAVLRLTMLETVREYAAAKLAEGDGEEDDARHRHALSFLALAETAAPRLRGPTQDRWLARLDADHDNLRAALAWGTQETAIGRGMDERAEVGLRLAGALWRFWYVRGYLGEGSRALEAALARRAGSGDAVAAPRARAVHGAAVLAESQGDYTRALAWCEEEVVLWGATANEDGMAGALNTLGNVATRRGELARATDLYERALTLWREVRDEWGIAAALNNLAVCVLVCGDTAHAARLAEESLSLRRRLGDSGGVAFTLDTLGSVARAQGDRERAAALYGEALASWRALGDRWGVATALGHLGQVALEGGEQAHASTCFAESLALCRDTGNRLGLIAGLEGLAAVAVARGHHTAAARLFGSAAMQREAMGTPLPAAERAAYERQVDTARTALGDAAFAAAWAAGQALPLEQAIAEPLDPAA